MRQFFLQNQKITFTLPSKTAGFTMVETLVAISILLVVIIGPMTIAQKGIQNSYFARDQLTAVFLAQEAIEAVREVRDKQALHVYDQLIQPPDSPSDLTWDWYKEFEDIDDDDGSSGDCIILNTGCGFNPSTRAFQTCGEIEACRLRVKDGVYTHEIGEGSPSLFTRKVYIEDKGTAVKVTVTVTWNAIAIGGTPKEVTLQTWVYDRYRHYES